MSTTNKNRIIKEAMPHLIGRKIVKVKYQTKNDADVLGWKSRAPILVLDNGDEIMPFADDEGNNGGVLIGNNFMLCSL